MVTFTIYVNPKQKRRDGTMNVKIIICYKRKRKMLSTSHYVTDKDLTRGGKLKNQSVIDKANKIIAGYRQKTGELGLELKEQSLEYIISKLTETKDMNFFSFADKFCASIKVPSTRHSYEYAVKNVERFVKSRQLEFSEMNKSFWLRFIDFMNGKTNGNTTNGTITTLTRLRSIYKKAQLEYNDEYNEIISSYPLQAVPLPSKVSTSKRALPIEKIREIHKLELKGVNAFVRDMFILSFCLMGMNLADMIECPRPNGDKICYRRKKTRNHRTDGAYMEVAIDPRVKPLLDKYAGQKMLINAVEQRSTLTIYNRVTLAMKNIGKAVGVPDLTFYAARHSFATIACNDCGIDKYTVHSALNHVPPEMKITDVYIKRDFGRENEANKKVLDLFFDEA